MQTETVLDRLNAAGHRLTASRKAVVESLARVEAHFTPDDLLRAGRETHPALGRATVYRTLELCTSLGLVRPVSTAGSGVHYILAEGGHHHLICFSCGGSIEFDECPLGGLGLELERRFDFEIYGHLLELYGRCADCRTASTPA